MHSASQYSSQSFVEHFQLRNLDSLANPTNSPNLTTRNSAIAPAILQSSVTLPSHKYIALSRPHFSIRQNLPRALVFRNFVHGSPPPSGCVMKGTHRRFDLLALFVSIGFYCPKRYSIPFVSSPMLSSITCSSRSWAVPSFLEDKTRNQDQGSRLGLAALSWSDWTFYDFYSKMASVRTFSLSIF